MRNRGWLFTSYDWTRSFHVPAGNSIHGDKDRHLPCACAALRLELMPDIILFRDCTLLSFLFLPFSCFPGFFIMMPFSKVRHFWFQCRPVAFLYIGEAIFIWCVPEPCGSVGVACQNKRVERGHSRRSGKISTLRVVFSVLPWTSLLLCHTPFRCQATQTTTLSLDAWG